MQHASKAASLDQRSLYEEILATSEEAPDNSAQTASISTMPSPSPSPADHGDASETQSELTPADDVNQPSQEQQRVIVEPREPASTLARRSALTGADPFLGQLPELKLVRVDSIFIHPLSAALYQQQGVAFPSAAPSRYLTPHGILGIARHLPIQLVADGTRLLCFGGLRLYLAALGGLDPSDLIAAVVYASISDAEMAIAIHIDDQILSFWFRETRSQREAHDNRHRACPDPRGLTFHDQDLNQLSELSKTCNRTVQYQTVRRKAQKK